MQATLATRHRCSYPAEEEGGGEGFCIRMDLLLLLRYSSGDASTGEKMEGGGGGAGRGFVAFDLFICIAHLTINSGRAKARCTSTPTRLTFGVGGIDTIYIYSIVLYLSIKPPQPRPSLPFPS